ncbi:MAG: LemA family protein [Actinomycetia bacterium]|nr:LemA family protein [Actinomycetes bacterium]
MGGGPVIIVLVVVVLILVALAAYGISAYNSLVRQRNLVEESWRQVDVEMNRRYDLIPNLVETVKGYAKHESGTLESVVKLRNQAVSLAGGATASQDRAGVEEQLTGAIRQLMVTVEAYPDLKANSNFVELQRQLTETEDRIAAGRRYYNANVRNYNTRIESFPTNLIANMGGFRRATYFEVNDAAVRQAPTVSFDQAPAVTPRADETPAIAAYEAPNFSVRSGTQDSVAAQTDPAQAGGTQFGYQPAEQPVTPPQQAAPGYGQAAPPYGQGGSGYGQQV